MQEELTTDTVIRHIYESSYTPEHWQITIELIAKYTHSSSAALFYTDNEVEDFSYSYTYNVTKSQAAKCCTCGTDPSFTILANSVPIGTAAAIDHIIPNREELENLYGDKFNDFLTKSDMYYIGGSLLFMDDVCSSGICLQRKKSTGPWTRDQIDRLNNLTPHLQHAMTINKEFSQLQSREQAFRRGLDRLFMGLILFDKELQPIYVNPVAKSILKNHLAISLKNGKIETCEHAQTERINTALRFAVTSRPDADPTKSSTSLGLKHPEYKTVLPVIISHVQGLLHGFETGGHHAHVALFFSDPDKTYPINANQLVEIYKLTPTESQVAISIANGISPDQIACMNNVAISTIRSQLKAIFHKIGVNSQAELVKVLLTGPFGHNMQQL